MHLRPGAAVQVVFILWGLKWEVAGEGKAEIFKASVVAGPGPPRASLGDGRMVVRERRMTSALGAVAVAAAVLVGTSLVFVGPAAADCAASCRSSYNQCRMETKGSPSCEGRFTSCMQGCRKK